MAYFFTNTMDKYNKQKVIVYIDGFNFYYGLKKNPIWKKYYWIDIVKLFEKFMRNTQELIAVKYFSARSMDKSQSLRQNAFFQANQENPKFHLILGKYLKKEIKCFNCNNIIHTYEEKESDVRIATQIIADAYENNFDIAIVVSADSDMMPAIEIVQQSNHKIYIYFPPNQYSNNLSIMGSGRCIQMGKYESRFKQSILPDKIKLLKNNFEVIIPDKWKNYQNR